MNDDRSSRVLYVGLDAGGTGTTAVSGPSGTAPSLAEGPGVNLQIDGEEAAVDRLVGLIRDRVRAHDSDRLGGVCAGLAGSGREDARERLAGRLARALELDRSDLRLVEDDRLALEAAFPSGSGVVVMAGTGSIVRGRDSAGREARAGGWGPLLGDEGGGHDVGLAGARAAALAIDGGPETDLVDRLDGEWEAGERDALIRLLHEREISPARLAPLVLDAAEAGDEVARAVAVERVGLLVRRVRALLDRPGWGPAERRLALGGGLAERRLYRRIFEEAVRDVLPGWSLRGIERSPARAAWEIARRSGAG